ncbi:RHS repeat-associated core domain-containing protein [Sorangium sp. So ce1024]|uniref:RHS repeat-associated core domain-containing protein n=1 Tax=unclassified Sorangium TaxID=2621164 RepID=UPI003F51F418
MRFPGQYEDAETGLYYNRYRYYDPADGMFVSPEPLGVAGGSGYYGYHELIQPEDARHP